ncbi:MMPL family transporter [Neisseria sp. Ec49-e6-T10]|uniref:MMPL family transporter n=1 Tax=Neisseria sp. Ec49-e6-T10 TaxID=3140744 RepID=UPI003EBF5AE3
MLTLNNQKKYTFFALLWTITVIALGILLCILLPRSQINTSVMALLPQEHYADIPDSILEGFSSRLDKQVIWLIKSPTALDAEPAKWWINELKKQPSIGSVSTQMTPQTQQQWGQFFFQHKAVLLDAATEQRLKNNTHTDWILSQIYSPFAGVGSQELKHDPLLLTRAIQLDQQKNARALQMDNGWLYSEDEQGNTWYFVHAQLKHSSFDMNSARNIVNTFLSLEHNLKQQFPGTEVLQRGTVFYSNYASELAQKDISTIGVASTLGIILLILLVFRSIQPIILTLLSLAVGVLAGITAVLACFGQIHIMTLVMSTSVVGISIDYALHYLTERMVHGKDETPLFSLNKLLPTLALALASSISAYVCLLFAPFAGLQQLAVFAIAGLAGAFFTVVGWYPFLAKKLPTRPNISTRLISSWLNLWQQNNLIRYGLPALIFIVSLIGLSQLKADDDIGKLQALPKSLQQQEHKIAQLTGQNNDQKWLIVYGNDAQETLQRLEHVSVLLNQAKQNQVLDDFNILPLPSLKKQKEHLALIQEKMPTVLTALQKEGIQANISTMDSNLVDINTWLAHPVSEAWRTLWLSLDSGQSAVLVPLHGIAQPAELKNISTQVAGVHWVDRKTELSELFATYRLYLSWLLVGALGLICLLFIYKMGVIRGIRCTLPLVLALTTSLSILALTGQTVNLFSLLALILVLGIGIDYTLFFSNQHITPTTVALSVFMAALTTELTFGLLGFSHTQAISGFGLVLSAGIFTAFLLAPIALPTQTSKKDTK